METSGTLVALTERMASPPYDQSFKSLADDDPEALLQWIGELRPGEPVTILTPPRELRTPSRVPDVLYEIRSGNTRRLVHIEAQTRYHSSLPERMLQYAALAWLHYRLPVTSYLVLLSPRDCPALPSGPDVVDAGNLWMRYERIKLWELAPDNALASDRPSLWPIVPLLRSDEADLQLIARRISLVEDEVARYELALRFVTMGRLRHDRKDLVSLLEERMITYSELEASGVYEKDLERLKQRSREEGIGRGAGRLLRRQLEQRFGPLPFWAVERIQAADLDTLEIWGLRLLAKPDSRLEGVLA